MITALPRTRPIAPSKLLALNSALLQPTSTGHIHDTVGPIGQAKWFAMSAYVDQSGLISNKFASSPDSNVLPRASLSRKQTNLVD